MLRKYLLISVLMTASVLFAQNKKTEWTGTASYYHPKFNGRKTASGQHFNNTFLTAANNFLKLGTHVKVTNLKNNQSVIVVINDRMNARNHRLIDVSEEAAKRLGFIKNGLCKVRLELINP
ncbi:MAG TPA: septal ring lytic transglycosylase RlpA family protein [Chitinophagaceae bacterium]|nr:septal ring lytic transglycosylase RlpA family protein [Chitinophagaceae bacterium]